MLSFAEYEKITKTLQKTNKKKIGNIEYIPARAVDIMLAYFTEKMNDTKKVN